ncbi:MAG: 2-dehydro-3-deoxygalactonokinase [Steroidobacteraceae bacterium]|jgi:2-dehydro-3-deoxygalactonokinase
MARASFIAGDWGTSHLRISLCDAAGAVLDGSTGPGAADSNGRFAELFDSLTARWQSPDAAAPLPAVLCGMVGSTIGWTEAPYVACPAMPAQIAAACIALRGGRIHIVPGLSCRNRYGAPDFMRGEETQILGALQLSESLRKGRCLLCLPGTHTKWVVLQDGSVREFFTAPTGELFALLREHSVLLRATSRDAAAVDSDAFSQALVRFNEFPQAQLLHRLFECRSRQLSGEFGAQEASAYLSGLLLASDVHGALAALADVGATRTVTLIGAAELTSRYTAALACHGYDARCIDGAAASVAGLVQVHRHLAHTVDAYAAR